MRVSPVLTKMDTHQAGITRLTSCYVQEWIMQEIKAQGAGLTDPLDLPNSLLCSDCMVNYWISKQATSYLNYDDDDSRDWSAIQKSEI